MRLPIPSLSWAHPRSRGENGLSLGVLGLGGGSSPLTRGKLGVTVTNEDGERLIPAHAGKTSRVSCMAACMSAHPRSRGENAVTINGELVSLGSSPLTRGKRCTGTSPHSAMRLIPAHAGKTSSVVTF